MAEAGETYVDDKGRTRWPYNEEIARKLQQLGDLLIIGGYEESHAARYGRIAYVLSRYPESAAQLHRQGRLEELPDVGPGIAVIIGELIETGSCSKLKEWSDYTNTPQTVLELTAIPRLGVKTVRTLYRDLGIDSLAALREALERGGLDDVKGLGPKTIQTIQAHLAQSDRR